MKFLRSIREWLFPNSELMGLEPGSLWNGLNSVSGNEIGKSMSKETDYERKEKRFAAACAAMSGILANEYECENVEKKALVYADALLVELERAEKPALSGWTVNGIPVEDCPDIVAMAKKHGEKLE